MKKKKKKFINASTGYTTLNTVLSIDIQYIFFNIKKPIKLTLKTIKKSKKKKNFLYFQCQLKLVIIWKKKLDDVSKVGHSRLELMSNATICSTNEHYNDHIKHI